MTKLISQLGGDGVFIGAIAADESPLETGVFLIPAGAVDCPPPSVTDGHYAQWTGAGFALLPKPEPAPEPQPEPLTVEQTIALYVTKIQERMDNFAQTRGYDGIASLVTYAGDPDPQLDAEGTYGKNARSATWVKSRAIYADVKSGVRQALTLDELFAELPVLTWPI